MKRKSGKPRTASISRARKAVVLGVFVLIGVGIALHTGWGTLSSLGYGAVAAVCPLGALETLVASKTLVPRALIVLIVVLAVGAVVGRAFCAWVCPVPPLSRFFHPERKGGQAKGTAAVDEGSSYDAGRADEVGMDSVGPNVAVADADSATIVASDAVGDMGANGSRENAACGRECASCPDALRPVGGKRDGRIVDVRHWVLGGSLLSAAVFGFPVFCLICPIGLVFATLIAVWRAIGFQEPSWSLLAFPAVLVLELAVFRKWCHKLCPLGALLSLLSWGNGKVKPRVDESACLRSSKGVDCKVCVDACPEELDPHSARIPECTKCGICVEKCPANAISLLGFSGAGREETDGRRLSGQ